MRILTTLALFTIPRKRNDKQAKYLDELNSSTYLEIVLMLEPGIVVTLGPDPLAVSLVTGRDSFCDSILIGC